MRYFVIIIFMLGVTMGASLGTLYAVSTYDPMGAVLAIDTGTYGVASR